MATEAHGASQSTTLAGAAASVRTEHGTFRSRRGYDLYTTTYTPVHLKGHDALVFHHGLSDHSYRHRAVLQHLVSALGVTVYTYDCLGHGRSVDAAADADKAYIASPLHLVDDLVDFTSQQVVGNVPQKGKVYSLGYSMGGMVCGLAAQRRPDLFGGIMLTSALTDVLVDDPYHVKIMKTLFVNLMSLLAPRAAFFPRNPVEAGIRDAAAVAEMKEDQLWYRGKFKPATVRSLLSGCRLLNAGAAKVTHPIYAQHGTKDVACSLVALQRFLARTKSTDVHLYVVQDGFHDLHHDPETPRCLEEMVAWLRSRLAP